MAKHSVLREFVFFIREEKKWWMVPLFVIGVAIALLLIFAEKAGPLSILVYPFI